MPHRENLAGFYLWLVMLIKTKDVATLMSSIFKITNYTTDTILYTAKYSDLCSKPKHDLTAKHVMTTARTIVPITVTAKL